MQKDNVKEISKRTKQKIKLSEELTLRDIHPKFASIIKQLYNIQQQSVKCRVFINFGANEEDISFRYEQIDPVELDKLARSIAKENKG